MKTIFFLGGHDLEMLAIKEVLTVYNQEFLDKELEWDNAMLNKYEKELKEYSEMGYRIYGVELRDAGQNLPDNYIAIDHHNQNEDFPSSLEQVCELLGKEMDRRLQLISVNDKAYIPGMVAMGATSDEISEIRHLDRKAQGVTEQEEFEAKRAIEEATIIRGLLCIKSNSKRFSPIIDRIYRKSVRTLVFTDSEFTYYGFGRNIVLEALKNHFPENEFYYGGGENGYLGIGPCGKENIIKMIQTIKHIHMDYSGHIFLFPFSWKNKKVLNKKNNMLENLMETKDRGWVRSCLPNKINDEDLYNELNFFYPFTHDTIYDQEGRSHNIWHFEREETQAADSSILYVIETKNKEYTLDVTALNINLYKTGVGLLSIYTRNSRYCEENDILAINQFGRRLFPPFVADIKETMEEGKKYTETPKSIKLNGLKGGNIEYSFSSDELIPNCPARFIKDLITSAVENIDEIRPVLDDRMFVMSWFKHPKLDISNDKSYNLLFTANNRGEKVNEFLYKYTFVDSAYASCQHEEMFKKQLESSIYSRWQGWGTVYGLTRYSFVMLTTPSCPEYLIQYFETEYIRMAELVLIQRASILRFSLLLKTENERDFSKYYDQYIDFLNTFRFVEVTAQEQGIELYDMLCQKMRIQENADYLDRQFNEREEYLELQNQGKLNILAALAVPIAIVSSVFGFFFRDSLSAMEYDSISCDFWKSSWPGWIAITLALILTFLAYYLIRRRQK